jgi:hypothetical protein
VTANDLLNQSGGVVGHCEVFLIEVEVVALNSLLLKSPSFENLLCHANADFKALFVEVLSYLEGIYFKLVAQALHMLKLLSLG